jgi:hypothetical protein
MLTGVRKRNLIIGGVVAVVVVAAWGASNGSSDGQSTTGPRGTSFGASGGTTSSPGVTAPAPSPTTEPVVAAPVEPDPAAVDPAAPAAPPADPAAPVAEPAAPVAEGPTEFRMPDLIGDDLDDAEAALTALGAERVKTVDANGDGRSQIMTSNWKVCSQDPRQGKDTDGDRKITLGVVKQSERCP